MLQYLKGREGQMQQRPTSKYFHHQVWVYPSFFVRDTPKCSNKRGGRVTLLSQTNKDVNIGKGAETVVG